MQKEIRINVNKSLLSKLFGRSTVNLVITFIAIISLFVVFLNPTQKTEANNYETEFLQLNEQNQLLKADVDLKKGTKVFVHDIVDGDTIKVTKDEETITVRYIGIDTPEIQHQGNGTNEPFGPEATKVNEMLVLNKFVYLFQDVAELDKYGRRLSYVYLEDGTMVNYAIIRMGYATILTIQPNVMFQTKFLAAQQLAREEKRGLWR